MENNKEKYTEETDKLLSDCWVILKRFNALTIPQVSLIRTDDSLEPVMVKLLDFVIKNTVEIEGME